VQRAHDGVTHFLRARRRLTVRARTAAPRGA